MMYIQQNRAGLYICVCVCVCVCVDGNVLHTTKSSMIYYENYTSLILKFEIEITEIEVMGFVCTSYIKL